MLPLTKAECGYLRPSQRRRNRVQAVLDAIGPWRFGGGQWRGSTSGKFEAWSWELQRLIAYWVSCCHQSQREDFCKAMLSMQCLRNHKFYPMFCFIADWLEQHEPRSILTVERLRSRSVRYVFDSDCDHEGEISLTLQVPQIGLRFCSNCNQQLFTKRDIEQAAVAMKRSAMFDAS